MKAKALAIILVFISTCLSAQTATKQYCDFLGPLHFVNGKANVIVEAKLYDLHRDDGSDELIRLKKDKKLAMRIIGGSAVTFIPVNCTDTVDAPIIGDWSILKTPLGSTIYLNCEVFKGYKGFYSKDLFIVNRISIKAVK